MQEARPPPTRSPADGAFSDPAFIDELIHDRGNGAALETGQPGQIGARHRIVPADEVQRDPAIDLARGLARGDLEVGKVDLAHRFGAFRYFVRVTNDTRTARQFVNDQVILITVRR